MYSIVTCANKDCISISQFSRDIRPSFFREQMLRLMHSSSSALGYQ